MTPLQVIEAATANGPATFGPMAPLTGQVKVGYDAGLIGLQENPIDDIGIFRDVNITACVDRREAVQELEYSSSRRDDDRHHTWSV